MSRRSDRILDIGLPLALAGLALVLRLATLRYKAAIIDELIELYIVTRPSWEGFLYALLDQRIQSPLHYGLAFLLARGAPSLEALRWISMASGAGAVLAVYFLGRRLHSRMFGCVWAFLLAISASHVLYSQTLRPYALCVFLAALSFTCLYDLVQGRSRWRYAAVMALLQAAYLHAVFIGLAQGLWVLWRRRGSWQAMALALSPSWLVLGCWYLLSGKSLAAGGGAPAWPDLSDAARAFCQQTGLSVTVYGALLGCAAVAAFRSRAHKDDLLLGWLGLLLPLAAITACHRYFQYLFHYRHILALLPVFLGLAAAPLAGLLQSRLARRPSAKVVLAGLVLFALFQLSLPATRTDIHMQEAGSRMLRQSVEILRGQAGPADAIVFSNPNGAAAALYQLDPESFGRLAGVEVEPGSELFSLFRLPADLRLGSSGLPVFALCSRFPWAATLDRDGFRRLKARVAAARGRIWFVHSGFLHYFPEEAPFASALGIRAADFVKASDSVFWIRPKRA
ncbi:MAG: glycosyltransferase family 39 protein [Elusimicrobia bacterium]|nr:glycosyltransferase family 39 protein [Elusimicrobiota bacterium]